MKGVPVASSRDMHGWQPEPHQRAQFLVEMHRDSKMAKGAAKDAASN
ncbi:MAG: hypothetical protein IRY99_18260 [Isosphaeraceae bacterium]|nr:hypothetical protein [Isosphaeraceae bacterium]